MKYLKVPIIIIITVLLTVSCNNSQPKRPEIKKGFLDLSSWNFEEDGAVDLNGEWEFYWEKLLEPKDFELSDSIKPEYIIVPGGWASKKSGGKLYPELGYATYRLKIKVPEKHIDYWFRSLSIWSSAKVWINGSFCFEKGKVATTKEQSKPVFLIDNIYANQTYDNKNDTLEIIIQVADFYRGGQYGGIFWKITFGTADLVYSEDNKTNSLQSSLVAIYLLIALYHLFLFAYKSNEFSYLIFSLMSLVFASRVIYFSGIFVDIFSYDVYGRSIHVSNLLGTNLMVVFFYFLYKEEVHKKVLYAFLIVALIFLPFVLTASPNMLNKLEPFILIPIFLPFIYLLGYLLLKAVIRKRQGSIFAYIGTAIILFAAIHDVLFAYGFIAGFGTFIIDISFTLFIILQSLNLAQIFSLSLKKNTNLNIELDYQNKNLETIVINRTQTIEEQKTDLENQNLNLMLQKEEIQTQNEDLNQKNKEITDSINYAQRIQSAILPPETYITELLHENFIFYKPRDIVSGDFYWIKQVNNFIILVAADCTGHGVPGAFMSMLGISYLNEIVHRREITQANQVLNELRKQVKYSLRQHGQKEESKDGMDVAICVLNSKDNKMQYSGAFNPLYLIKDVNGKPELQEIKADRMPVGFYHGRDKTFTNHEIQLEMGDTFYIFSDGFTDQTGGKDDKKYMSKNFKNLLLEIHEDPMYEQKEILDKTLNDWMGDSPQMDDILVIGVRI